MGHTVHVMLLCDNAGTGRPGKVAGARSKRGIPMKLVAKLWLVHEACSATIPALYIRWDPRKLKPGLRPFNGLFPRHNKTTGSNVVRCHIASSAPASELIPMELLSASISPN